MKRYYEDEEIKDYGFSARSIYICEDFSIHKGRTHNTFHESNKRFVQIRDKRYSLEYFGGEKLTSQILIILETKDSQLIPQALQTLLIKTYLGYFLENPEDFIEHMKILREEHFEDGRKAKQVELLNVLGIITEKDQAWLPF